MPDESVPQIPEMVERVARSISLALFGYFDHAEICSSTSPSAQALIAAHASIAVMREPTPAICEAIFAAASVTPHPQFGPCWTASDVWQAGFDAALKE